MTRYRIGFFCAVLAVTGCDHHQQPSSEQSAAIAQADAPYTGQTPGAPTTSPRTEQVAANPPPSTPPKTESVPVAETPPRQSIPPRAPVPEPREAAVAPAQVPTTESTPAPAEAPHSESSRPETIPPSPVVTTPPPPALTETEAQKSVVVLETSLGRIVIELDDVSAPRTCGNFRKLVSDGFYNHTVFHRVIPNFMIQGGDPNSKLDERSTYGQGNPGYTLPAEIHLKHTAGAVAMARLPDAANPQRDSNGSQFYICVEACPSLDGLYTVFGHVIRGMDVANKIANQPRDQRDNPTNRIEMQASLETKKQALEDSGT